MAKTIGAQLVQLYERKTKTGITYYLHYTLNGEQIRENTHLRLTGDKDADKAIKRAAQMMQADKTAEILGNRTGIATQSKKNAILLAEYCDKMAARYQNAASRSSDETKCLQIKRVAGFIRDTDAKIKLCNVSKSFCEKLAETIARAPIANNTKSQYFARFVFLLNQAVKAELIQSNPATRVDERPRIKSVEKVYLTESELKAFADVQTDTAKEQTIKDGFIFSALTGLRFSDVARLGLQHVEESPEGIRIKIETQKTKKYISFILSPECSNIIRRRIASINAAGAIFALPSTSYTNEVLKDFAQAAKIEKAITFHSARHTFATLLLTKGVDLYTVSTLLGHSDIKTTQVYAKIIDKKKDDAVKLLGGIL